MAATMRSEESQGDAAPQAAEAGGSLSRRQALGRMSAVATAGAAAWVVPEILTAKPAAGATLSGGPSAGGGTNGVTSRGATTADPGTTGAGGTNGVNTAAGTTTPVK